MALTKTFPNEKKELDRFTKYLVYKCIQAIVQSRLGEKIKSRSKPILTSGADWFNLGVTDMPEVLQETKRVFSGSSSLAGQFICVEISLKTVDGENMVLETWWLMVTDQGDVNGKGNYVIYNRMGVLLKSLLCVTRIVPAYKLSRKQGPDSYVICYRIYRGCPQTDCLGKGFKTVKVGLVPIPRGIVQLNVAYRTRMLISPHQSVKDLGVDLKDDHFTEESPRRQPCCKAYKFRHISEESRQDTTEDQTGQSPPPGQNGGLSSRNSDQYLGQPLISDKKPSSFTEGQKIGAFAREDSENSKPSTSPLENDIPFGNLLIGERVDANANTNIEQPAVKNGITIDNMHMQDTNSSNESERVRIRHLSGDSSKSGTSPMSAPGDFVMIELKTPFADTDEGSDLTKFYRECQGLPRLNMFQEPVTAEDTINGITDQLSTFEENTRSFDDFIDSLQASDS